MLESKTNSQDGPVKLSADLTTLLIYEVSGLREEASHPLHPGVNNQESSELLYMEFNKRSHFRVHE